MKEAIQLAPSTKAVKEDKIAIPASDLRPFEEDLEHLRKLAKENKLFSPKYWRSQKERVIKDVRELFKKDPSLSIKQVVLTILAGLPDFIPSWNIERTVGYITQTWRELSNAEESPETNE